MKSEGLELSSSRRGKLLIFAEILDVAKKGAPKTRIMYKVNLNFKGVGEYLSFMLKTRLLAKTSENDRTIYKTTEKGLAFLGSYSQLIQLIYEDGDVISNINMVPASLFIREHF
jgi:predicted transcriptional regulator